MKVINNNRWIDTAPDGPKQEVANAEVIRVPDIVGSGVWWCMLLLLGVREEEEQFKPVDQVHGKAVQSAQ
jgi:hypothetical protein